MLNEKIKSKKAIIGVIGLGYVGFPLVRAFSEAGFRIIGIDNDRKKIELLNKSRLKASYTKGWKPKDKNRILFTADPKNLRKADVILICVPTPLDKNKTPDLSYIINAAENISRNLKKEKLIILESTTYPGTTDECVLPILERSELKAKKDFYLAFSPERVDPGNKKFNIRNTPKVVGGIDRKCTELALALYEHVAQKVIPVSSTKVAESVKLLENIFRGVNIALVNELALLCRKLKIDVFEVIKAASTKPFGFMPFYPGPGLGGHCIPIDPFYLSWKGKEFDFYAHFIELAGEVNNKMPYYVADLINEALNNRGKSLKGSKIFILGAAYKKDIDDLRESPALKVIEILKEKNAIVYYNDPYIPEIKLGSGNMRSKKLDALNLRKADCTVIVTDHSSYDYTFIVKNSKSIVDTRNATENVLGGKEKIIRI